jgi:hypothetical protein
MSERAMLEGADRLKPTIVIPTSNRYTEACRTTLRLLNQFWPGHPPVHIVALDQAIAPRPVDNAWVFQAGLQDRVTWTEALEWYLARWSQDDVILLLLEDYGLYRAPDFARLSRAASVIHSDPAVASFHLTNMAIPSSDSYQDPDIVAYPAWDYSVNLQAAFWRTSRLRRLLQEVGPDSADAFELRGSKRYNTRHLTREKHLTFETSRDTPMFLDSDPRKDEWALPYHNLVRRGTWEHHYRHMGAGDTIRR